MLTIVQQLMQRLFAVVLMPSAVPISQHHPLWRADLAGEFCGEVVCVRLNQFAAALIDDSFFDFSGATDDSNFFIGFGMNKRFAADIR